MKHFFKGLASAVSLSMLLVTSLSIPAFAGSSVTYNKKTDKYTVPYSVSVKSHGKTVKRTLYAKIAGSKSTSGVVKDGSSRAVLAVARSQDGYYPGESLHYTDDGKSVKKRISYYSNIWAQKEVSGKSQIDDSHGNWCSEFASWCIREAGVPASECEAMVDTEHFRVYFSDKNRLYAFSESKPVNTKKLLNVTIKKQVHKLHFAGTLNKGDLKPGDILQINDQSSDNGYPNHTAIFVRVSGNRVYTYDGNKNVGGQRKVVARDDKKAMSYKLSQVKAVIRPHYTDEQVSSASISDKTGSGTAASKTNTSSGTSKTNTTSGSSSAEKTSSSSSKKVSAKKLKVSVTREGKNKKNIRVHVSGLKSYSGYKYIITISGTDVKNYETAYYRKSVLFDKSGRFKKNKKYTVTLKAKDINTGKVSDLFTKDTVKFKY